VRDHRKKVRRLKWPAVFAGEVRACDPFDDGRIAGIVTKLPFFVFLPQRGEDAWGQAPDLRGRQAQVNHSARDNVNPVLLAVYWIGVSGIGLVSGAWGEAFEIA